MRDTESALAGEFPTIRPLMDAAVAAFDQCCVARADGSGIGRQGRQVLGRELQGACDQAQQASAFGGLGHVQDDRAALILSIEAQVEAHTLMMSTNNIFSPSNGAPIEPISCYTQRR